MGSQAIPGGLEEEDYKRGNELHIKQQKGEFRTFVNLMVYPYNDIAIICIYIA